MGLRHQLSVLLLLGVAGLPLCFAAEEVLEQRERDAQTLRLKLQQARERAAAAEQRLRELEHQVRLERLRLQQLQARQQQERRLLERRQERAPEQSEQPEAAALEHRQRREQASQRLESRTNRSRHQVQPTPQPTPGEILRR